MIKVEPIEGEIFRYAQPMKNEGMGARFLTINRNKRSIAFEWLTRVPSAV